MANPLAIALRKAGGDYQSSAPANKAVRLNRYDFANLLTYLWPAGAAEGRPARGSYWPEIARSFASGATTI
jgi:hypothetical protein